MNSIVKFLFDFYCQRALMKKKKKGLSVKINFL